MAAAPYTRRIPKKTTKTITFTGAAGLGAQGTVAVFGVTGRVLITHMSAYCSTLLAGASATIEAGTAGNTAALIAQSTATDIDATEFWKDSSPEAEVSDAIVNKVVAGDVILTVGTADITSGELVFDVYWLPLSEDGDLSG